MNSVAASAEGHVQRLTSSEAESIDANGQAGRDVLIRLDQDYLLAHRSKGVTVILVSGNERLKLSLAPEHVEQFLRVAELSPRNSRAARG